MLDEERPERVMPSSDSSRSWSGLHPSAVSSTILALATPAAPSPRVIVRTSGPAAFDLARSVGAHDLAAGRVSRQTLRFAGLAVEADCYAFRGPRSHTGEDVVEYHLPGSPLLCRLLLDALVKAGGRPAQPGEFTARAYFNGKVRLDEAEAVQAAIAAGSDAELAAANRLRAGDLAEQLEPTLDDLATLLARCEAGIDFTDEEDVVVLPADEARSQISDLKSRISELLASATRFEELARPPIVALVGRPNAGKSTLLNAMAGRTRAVASPTAGTTRDALAVEVELPGGPVRLLDLAGVGDLARDDLDAAAQQIATRQIDAADVLVLVKAADDDRPDLVLSRPSDVTLTTKGDLAGAPPEAVSAVTGRNLDRVRRMLSHAAFAARGSDRLALNARHVRAIGAAAESLDAADAAFAEGLGDELAALLLREALDHLGGILGAVTPDDVLGRIFGTFCVGK